MEGLKLSNIITGNAIAKLAFDNFGYWMQKYLEAHPDNEKEVNELVEIYARADWWYK